MNTTTIKTFLFILLNILSFSSYSQESNTLDSLKNAISTSRVDTSTIKLYFEIAEYFEGKEEDSVRFYYHKGIELAQNLKSETSNAILSKTFTKLNADGLNKLGAYLVGKEKYEEGKEFLLKSYKLKKQFHR